MFCRYLAVLAFFLAFFVVVPALGQTPNLIQPPVEGALSSPMLVTATASNGQVQFVALTPAQQIRLEILSQVGETLFDSDFHPGNLLRWEVKDQQGSYLQDGLYGCLVTVEDLNGQVSHRKGAFQIKDGMFWFQGQQQNGMTTETAVQDQDNLIILQPDSPLTLAVHDDQGGLIESGRGALDFHAGTFSPTPGNTIPHMRLTPEGNVGIGVATPEAKLDVAGLIRAREGIQFADGTVLKMDGGSAVLVAPRGSPGAGITSSGRTGFTTGAANGNTSRILTSAGGIRPMATSGTSGQIAKFTNSTDLGSSVITESAGNIGIGTTGPSVPLELSVAQARFNMISTTGTNNARIRFNNNSGDSWVGVESGGGGTLFVGDSSYAAVFGTSSSYPVQFATSGFTRMTIDATKGNVGIGTTGPSVPLELSVAAARFNMISTTGTNNARIRFNNTGGDSWVGVESSGAGTMFTGDSAYAAVFGTSSSYPVQFATNSYTRMTVATNGNVGIGTTGPSVPLELSVAAARFNMISTTGTNNSRIRFNNTSGDSWVGVESSVGGTLFSGDSAYATVLGTSSSYPVQFGTSGITRMTVDNSGNVGIGTASPGAKLEIAGNLKLSGSESGITFPDGTKQTTASTGASASFSSNTSNQILNVTQLGNGYGITVVSGSDAVRAEADDANATGVLGQAASTTGVYTIGVWGTSASINGLGVYGQANGALAYGVEGDGGSIGVSGFALNSGGIGVLGDAEIDGGIGVKGKVGGTAVTAGRFEVASGSGNILIGATSGSNVFRVDTTGQGFFNGGVQPSGADFAEAVMPVGSRKDYQPGDVLVIDEATSRSFHRSSQPYSTAVAGIYSTKPGVLATPNPMDDAHSSAEIPLAVVGIVPCKVSAENGPIERGDLLVTSSTLGYAMKGTDRMRMLGAIVGKALDPLPQGTGVIRVLVTLQ